MNGCKHRNGLKCNLFSNDWAEARCIIKNEKDCPYLDPVVITNADHIRSMTDEELAEFLWSCGQPCCPPIVCKADKCSADECWLDWLKSPVEVDK